MNDSLIGCGFRPGNVIAGAAVLFLLTSIMNCTDLGVLVYTKCTSRHDGNHDGDNKPARQTNIFERGAKWQKMLVADETTGWVGAGSGGRQVMAGWIDGRRTLEL